MLKPYVVGITGGSASGKTLLLEELIKTFDEGSISVISQDNYYRPIEEQIIDENHVVNFDLPESIDHISFAKDIKLLKGGEVIHQKEYTFNNRNAKEKIITTHPTSIIIVEGIFVFYHAEIIEQLDMKVFIDARHEIMLERRIKRDAEERGYDLEDVNYRFKNHVMPTYIKYIEPCKEYADLVITNNENHTTDVFKSFITRLSKIIVSK